MNRSVAIVGRPNVGKSRLFNRLARKRISIVHDQAGITRDVITVEIADGEYTLLDTGGLGLTGNDTPVRITKASEEQVAFAIETAGLVLFIIDGLDVITELDQRIASRLRRSGREVVLVINKADFDDDKVDMAEAYRLGLGEPMMVSAEHGRGEHFLREKIIEKLGPVPVQEEDSDRDAAIRICFVGRPNVGKSSLSNRLTRSDRLIVSDVPGTTRDSVELDFAFTARNKRKYNFRLVDTAGIRANTKLSSPVEYFSRLRSLEAIQRTDVVFLVLDAIDGVTQQDKAIAGEAIKERKPIVIIVNKWDLVHKAFKNPEGIEDPQGIRGYESEREYREKYKKAVFGDLFFTPGSPIIFVSALSGYEVSRMLNATVKLYRTLDTKLPTGRLNSLLGKMMERTPPPAVGGKRFRIYYATQSGYRPFRIKIFCNNEKKLSESYRRYLQAGMVKEFELDGCPFYFELIGKDKHTPGAPYTSKNTLAAKAAKKYAPCRQTLED